MGEWDRPGHPVADSADMQMHAGGEHAPDTRQTHRIAESWDLANAIRDAAAKGRHVMVVRPYSLFFSSRVVLDG